MLMAPGTRRLRRTIGFLVLSPALALGACGQAETAGPENGVGVEQIRERDVYDDGLDRFVGKTVTVSAEVARIVTPSAFEIAGEGGPKPILVITPPTTAAAIPDDSVVKVTGQVRELAIAEVERDLGVDLDDTALATYIDEHIIVADTVEVIDRDG